MRRIVRAGTRSKSGTLASLMRRPPQKEGRGLKTENQNKKNTIISIQNM